MLNLNTKLKQLEEQGKKINIGLVGAGQMGRGMTSQMFCMKGIRPAVISDLNLDNAKKAYILAGVKEEDIAAASTPAKAEAAIKNNKYVITDNFEVATKALPIDAVIDATGVPEVGAQIALESIYNGKHIVMLNVETDVTVGPFLKKMADSANVVYTVSAGDEPGAIKELYDFADGMGFEVVVAGKGKNNKLNREANPDTEAAKSVARKMNVKMQVAFTDGTKTMVEMACVSNALGFKPTTKGLIGPESAVNDLPKLLSLKSQGGILDNYYVVEYINGIAPGVFVIITTQLDPVKEEMAYLSMGEGPNYVLYRPYHLCSIETPLSAARAYVYHEPTIAPGPRLVSEVTTIAKKDLRAGEHLDGIGGYTVHGSIDTYENALKENALPLGLVSKNVVLTQAVKKGQTITYDMVKLDENSAILQMRRLQDVLTKG